MKISIVVDNYNYARFLPAAIDSALAQTWADTEVLVIDDGSTDHSRAVMDTYSDQVTALHKENGGQTSALNAAFEAVSGDVVIFLDADDRIGADTAARVAEVFERAPDTARVQWPLAVIDSEGIPTGVVAPHPEMMPTGDLREHIARYRTHVWPAQSGNAYSHKVLEQLVPMPTADRVPADLYLAEATALLGDVVSLPDVGGDYRVHGDNFYADHDFDADHIRKKMRWTMTAHDSVHRIAPLAGTSIPADPRAAHDIAFTCQRLASLRLDAPRHPFADDSRPRLLLEGWRNAIVHPHHTLLHKLKRLAWVTGVALGPRPLARRLIRRLYFSGK